MFKLFSAVLLISLFGNSIGEDNINCPDDSSIISPCTCTGYTSWGSIGPTLHCGGDKPIDFGKITKQLSEIYRKEHGDRIFDIININNSAITEINENDFSDLRFGTINIFNCKNLTKIHKNAFGDTYITGTFVWINNQKVDSKQVFELIDNFPHVEIYYVYDIDQIPSRAFDKGSDQTYSINLGGNRLKTIGSKSFANFSRSQGVYITIEESSIDSFPDEAFAVKTNSLNIRFYGNVKLSGDSFSKNTLKVGEKTTTTIEFKPVVAYLDQNAFETFFNDNSKNTITITSGNLDCTDDRNQWLSPFVSRIKGYNC